MFHPDKKLKLVDIYAWQCISPVHDAAGQHLARVRSLGCDLLDSAL